ncbi:MAG: hypothetical protein KBT30_01075 [Clostridiales bacterium]|nr:hypothetical protein [Candidatus Apopatousia equi]
MKRKIIVILLVIVLAVSGIAVVFIKPWENRDLSEYGITIINPSLNKKVNEGFNLTQECGISCKSKILNEKPVFLYVDDKIDLDVSTGIGVCKNEGVATIKVSLKISDTETREKYITINISRESVVFPLSAYFQHESIKLDKNFDTKINKVLFDGECNIEPSITIKNNLVSYDYLTGEVKSKGTTGSDEITLKFYKDEENSITISFTVEIVDGSIREQSVVLHLGEVKQVLYEYTITLAGQVEVENDNVIIPNNETEYTNEYVVIFGNKIGECTITIKCVEFDLKIYVSVVE